MLERLWPAALAAAIDASAAGLLGPALLHNAVLHIGGRELYGREAVLALASRWIDARREGTACEVVAEHTTDRASFVRLRLARRAQGDRELLIAARLAAGRVRLAWAVEAGAPDAAAAVRAAAKLEGPIAEPYGLGEVRLAPGQFAPPPDAPRVPGLEGSALLDRLHRAWNERRPDLLAPPFAAMQADMRGLLAAMPDGVWIVEQGFEADAGLALVWRFVGRHSGMLTTGPESVAPTGFRLHVRGLTCIDRADGDAASVHHATDWTGLAVELERCRMAVAQAA